uniref:hypothetical protein n=1 Tax=Fuscoporia viticola TaxID=139386 RepID=UPI0023AA557B|nr:hypothetical protein P1Q19_mgp15 [Fuscoporia viticola]WCF76844.1 hypothetical protein [Fuscoporia viticola]
MGYTFNMKNTKNIKLAASVIKKAVKSRVASMKANRPRLQLPKNKGNVFTNLSLLFSILSYANLLKYVNIFAKRILGPYYLVVIPYIVVMYYLFRKSMKLFVIFNLIVAVFLYINNLMGVDIEMSSEFLLYFCYSIYSNIMDYIYNFYGNIYLFFKSILDKINDYFFDKQYEYKKYAKSTLDKGINHNPYPSDKASYNNKQFNNYFEDDNDGDDYYFSNKTVLITIGIVVIIIGGIIYYQDPTYYNTIAYNSFTTVKDYIVSYFWDDSNPKPDASSNKGKGVDRSNLDQDRLNPHRFMPSSDDPKDRFKKGFILDRKPVFSDDERPWASFRDKSPIILPSTSNNPSINVFSAESTPRPSTSSLPSSDVNTIMGLPVHNNSFSVLSSPEHKTSDLPSSPVNALNVIFPDDLSSAADIESRRAQWNSIKNDIPFGFHELNPFGSHDYYTRNPSK